MSQRPINLSPDLKRLREEGYFIQLRSGFLILRDVPYLDSQMRVQTGTLISSLALSGDVTKRPDTHVVYFEGEYPHGTDGRPISQVRNSSKEFDLGSGLRATHRFSSKPSNGYSDFYHKMTTYVAILSGPAEVVLPSANPRTFRIPEPEEDSVFNYTETASDRVGIGSLSALLADEKIAIVGLGGTGSYVLDFIAKTAVREIRLFDGDEFLQHNAFRAPGAPSIERLREAPKKVDYFSRIYSSMHRGIVANPVSLGSENLHLLDGITFAFLCMDGGVSKRIIVKGLMELNAPFIDVGMGLELVDGSLGGIVRVTTSTPEKRDSADRIPFVENELDDVYSSNIQVADLNALNAAMAVIKWKKMLGFYRDFEQEHHSTYTTDGNLLLNDGLTS